VSRVVRVAALGICTSLALTLSAAADVVSDARELAMMWQPKVVRFEKGSLTLVLPQRSISEEIYFAVLTSGLCLGPLLGKPLTGVSEIVVLNQFERQGYVYEKGLEACREFNERPAGDPRTRIDVLGATHWH